MSLTFTHTYPLYALSSPILYVLARLKCTGIDISVDMQLFDAPIRNAVLSNAYTEMLIEHFGELSVRITMFDVLTQPFILFGCITMLTHGHVPVFQCRIPSAYLPQPAYQCGEPHQRC